MRRILKKGLQALGVLVAFQLGSTAASADQVLATEVVVEEEMVEAIEKSEPCPDCAVNNGSVSFAMGNDIVTAYYFRGYLQEKKGFITQPWAEVGFSLWESSSEDGFFTDLGFVLGNWNSIQTEQTLSTDGTGPGNWYEADLYAGVSLGTSIGLSAGLTYVAYMYPNGAFATVQELDLDFSYDDSSLYSGVLADYGFALSPYILFAFELENGVGVGGKGTYFEVGVEPAIEVLGDTDYPISISVPIALGLSADDYYYTTDANGDTSNDDFGFASVGLSLGVPFAFFPTDFGSMGAAIGATYVAFGESLQDANGGSGSDWYGTFGLSWEY